MAKSHSDAGVAVGPQGPPTTAPGPQQKASDRQVGGAHYKQMAIEPWDVMQAVLSRDEWLGFLKGNVLKYALRAGRKAGADDDAQKAEHYRQKLFEELGIPFKP